MLTTSQILQLCSFSLLLAMGQIFFKLTAQSAPPLNSIPSLFSLSMNIWFWAAILFYAVSTLIWISVLQQVALSVAYPFAALGFIFVPLASYLIFKEPLNWQYGVGVVLILIALRLITVGK